MNIKRQVFAGLKQQFQPDEDKCSPIPFYISLCGKYIEMNFYDEGLKEKLTISFNHLSIEKPQKADMRVHIWEEELPEGPPEFCLPYLSKMVWRGGNLFFKDDAISFMYASDHKYFEAFNDEEMEGFYCICKTPNLPFLHVCHPLRQILHWWSLKTTDYLLAHAAAIGVDGTGVLLTAAGGRGKSTTAISCLLHGCVYAGDDYVLLSRDGGIAEFIYSTGYLNPDMVNRLSVLDKYIVGRDETRNNKTLVDLSGYKSLFYRQLRISSILYPVIGAIVPSISPAVAKVKPLTAFAASTTLQNEGWMNQRFLNHMFTAVKKLPLYEFKLSADFVANAECLKKFILATRSEQHV